MPEHDINKIVSLCKRRGFIFQGSEIYGGLANTWDYGPYGAELKNNLKRAWWKSVVYDRDDIYGMDAAILMHPRVWEASGHVSSFIDKYIDCNACKKRIKADDPRLNQKESNRCPECGNDMGITDAPRDFNLLLKTSLGALEDRGNETYFRPETAQGMFVNFLNILDSRHPRLPFGMAQIGKAFRNEITTGNFTFRTREFEQMEIEYFVNPEEADKFYRYWVGERFEWYIKLGINKKNLRKREHAEGELAHYARACTDIEYNFPFGWSELEGIANRTDFDLRKHEESSGRDMRYFDSARNERFHPYIIEPSGGVDRSILAFLADAYHEEKVRNDTRVVLKLHRDLAPTKAAVLPLLKKRGDIVELAKRITGDLKKSIVAVYDDTAGIGKLYRRQDEVGTPYCVTVDVQSLDDKKVTVRQRDTMEQERIAVDNLGEYLNDKFKS